MKIKCDKTDLTNAMNIVLKAVPNRTTNAILECVLVEAKDGVIKLTSNDMEMAINTVLEGTIFEPGEAAINANMLSNIADKLPRGDVDISAPIGEKAVKIVAGKSKFTIPYAAADDFVGMPKVKTGVTFSVSQGALKRSIIKTVFCADVSGSNKNALMAGCNLAVEQDTLTLCALDGHRIAIRKAVIDGMVDRTDVTLPIKTLQEIAKIIGNGEERININITKAHVLFQFGATIIVSRILTGDFFDISKILKTEPSTRIVLSANEFMASVNRSTVLMREGDKKALVLEISDDVMHMETQTCMGMASDDLEIDKEGDDLKVGYNPRFLYEVLKNVDHDEIKIGMCGQRGPAIITEEDGDYTYVILPINITG